MSLPVVVVWVHVGHCSAGDEDEVVEAQVASHVAGLDGAFEDPLCDIGEFGLLLGDLGPICLLGSEDGVAERRVVRGVWVPETRIRRGLWVPRTRSEATARQPVSITC